jgi:hypothetical protein
MKKTILPQFKIAQFFRLNLISLNLNYSYKLNIYLILLLFICIISSIFIRSNLINLDITELLDSNNVFIRFSIILIFILSSIYSIKLVFDNINRSFQAIKIIPDFINWYKQDVKNIKSIISLYYLQNLFFVLLSSYILYNIISKLSLFINNVDLFILISGLIFSFIFIYNYPLKSFILNTNIKTYPIWVYLLLILLFILWIFIFPFIIFKIIESDKFISFKNDLINKCLENISNNMDADNDSLIVENNISNHQNTISVPNRNRLEITRNITSDNNSITVRDNRNSLTLHQVNIENYNVGTQTVNNLPQLTNENNLLTNENQGNNLLNNNNPNPLLTNNNNLLTNTSNNNNPFLDIVDPSSSSNVNVHSNNRSLVTNLKRNYLNTEFDNLFTRPNNIKIGNIPEIFVTDTSYKNENELSNNSQENLLNNNENENELSNNSQENLLNNKIIKKSSSSSSSSKLNFKDKIIHFINKSKTDTNLRIKKFKFISQDFKFKFINKDFLLLKDNPLRILTKNLIRLSDYISIINKNLGKLPVNETKLEVMNIYIDLINNIEDFKNIQTCLLDIKDLNKIDVLLDQYRIEYLTESESTANSNFIELLHRMLIDDRLLFVNDFFVFKEYYVLNDLDYLNYKNKNQIIDLRIFYNLYRSLELNKILIETLNLDLKFKDLLINYNSKVQEFYNHFDKFTLYDYNRKYELNLPVININQIKNTREIDFFEILLKK